MKAISAPHSGILHRWSTALGSKALSGCFLPIIGVMSLLTSTLSADVNVLLVGTTKDLSQKSSSYGTSKAFNISSVRTELKKILDGAGMGTVNVGLHDFSTNGDYANNLVSEFYDQKTSYPPTSFDFWKNLRGENGTDWDVVILMEEPNTTEYYPAFFSLAAMRISQEVAKGGAQTVLFMPWPGKGSTSTVNHYKEVYYRIGRSLGCKVVPAGLAWEAQGSVHGSGTNPAHPTSDGAYLAAAAIFSRVWGVEGQDKSASTSTYQYNDTLADAVHQLVKDYKARPSSQIYTGAFVHPVDVFSPIRDTRREWVPNTSLNSSTESGVQGWTKLTGRNAGMDLGDSETVSGPRGTHVSRDWNAYNSGNKLNSHFVFASYGGDEAGFINLIGSDAYSWVRSSASLLPQCPTYRHLPHPALFAQVYKEHPETPLYEFQHGSRAWSGSAASFWVTQFSGRCTLYPPSTATTFITAAHRIGYETAWAMMNLQARAPGFQVLPSDWKRHEVDPVAPETMTVCFRYKPTHNVTVNISTDQTWASVSPATLTFTPENYNTPQPVTVSVGAEAASLRGSLFNVNYSTSSTDEVCHGLTDTWEYGVNTLPVIPPITKTLQVNETIKLTLTSTDPDINSRVVLKGGSYTPKQIISYSLVEGSGPANGQASINGDILSYTPNPGFAGLDSVQVRVFDGLAFCEVPATVQFNVVAKGQYNMNLIQNPGGEFGSKEPWIGAGYTIAGGRSGAYSFTRGTLYQDVDISDFSGAIDSGLQYFDFSGYVKDASPDQGSIALEFRDANGKVLGIPYESPIAGSSTWKLFETKLLAPENAVVARVILRAVYLSTDGRTDASFDDLSLTATRPDNRAPKAVNPPLASVAQNVATVIPLTATDVDRLPADTLSYEIIAGAGPAHGSITGWQNGMPVYTPNAGYLGYDSFQYRVYDGQLWSTNVGVAQILVRENEAPTITVHTPVMPDSNIIYMPATAGVIFETTVTDDGGPANGALSIQWEQLQGPFAAVFDAPNSETTACTWGPEINPGTYVFRMTASDGQYATTRDFTIVVLNGGYEREENVGVQVDVGGSYDPVGVGEWLQLQGGSLSDDGKPLDPGVNTIEWTKIAGAGNATFEKADSYETKVMFDFGGTYVLRLTADDGQIKAYEDVTVTVTGPSARTLTVIGGTAEGGSYYASGAVVPIVANTPAKGYRFVNWTTSDGGIIANATASSTTYTMPAGNATVTANFALNNPPSVTVGGDQLVALANTTIYWSPLKANPVLLLDGSDTSTITANGSNLVSEWRDKSGNGLHLSQGTSTLQPLTGATINGKNAIDFTGDRMDTASNPFGAAINNAFVIAVHKHDALVQGALFSLSGSSSAANRWQAMVPWDSGSVFFDCGGNSSGNRVTTAYGVPVGSTAMVGFYGSKTDNVQQIYKNGTLLLGDTSGHTVNTAGNIRIGSDFAPGYQNTTIGEMIVINGTVDTDTREKLEGYLAHKWGLGTSLPSGHTYEDGPPSWTGPIAIVNLNGSVQGGDPDPYTTQWVVRSAPAGATVEFDNAKALNTTASFYQAGTYILRLVVTESIENGLSSYKEVTITVAEEGAATHTVTYTAGANGTIAGLNPQIISEGLDAASVTAVPNYGYTFIGWSDGLTTSTRTDTNVTADISVTANFQYNQAPTVNAGGNRTAPLLPAPSTPWDPASIAQLWLDAADGSTVVADGNGLVSEWKDKSPNGLNVVQVTPSQQPVTGSSINGKNAIDFTGDRMGTTSNPFGETINDGFIIIVKRLDSTANGMLFGLTGTDNGPNRWLASVPYGGNVLFDCAGGVAPNRVQKTYGVTAGSTTMVSFYNSTTDSVQEVYKDGVKLVGDASGHAVPTAGNILIGGVGSSYQDVTIGEAVVINGTVSPDTRWKLEGYLAHKWGLGLPSGHTYESGPPMVENYLATVTLNGSVNDGNGTTPTITWSVVSTQPAGLPVQLSSTSSPVTTASFTATGTYTLRLTANDGVAAPVTDDVVITVIEPMTYTDWIGGSFAKPFTDTAMTSNPDGDRRSNLMEFAFGTDPTIADMGPLATDGSKRGDPVAAKEQDGGFALYYIRRADHGNPGSVIYSTHFSNDLTTFEPSSVGLEVVASAGSGYEVVKVPFPASLSNGKPARFGYVQVAAP